MPSSHAPLRRIARVLGVALAVATSVAVAVLASAVAVVAFTVAVAVSPGVARAAETPRAAEPEAGEAALAGAVPDIASRVDLGPFNGRPLARVEVVSDGPAWGAPSTVSSVKPGEPLTAAVARRAARELLDSGAVARLTIRVLADAEGRAVLRLSIVARRLVASMRIEGGALDDDETLADARIALGDEVTPGLIAELAERVRRLIDPCHCHSVLAAAHR